RRLVEGAELPVGGQLHAFGVAVLKAVGRGQQRAHGQQDYRTPRGKATGRLRGCKAARLRGGEAARLRGCEAARLRGRWPWRARRLALRQPASTEGSPSDSPRGLKPPGSDNPLRLCAFEPSSL